MQKGYTKSLTNYKRLLTQEVMVGNLGIGAHHPIRVQTMTTMDTLDIDATVAQTIKCIESGAELVRITAPSKKEAENLLEIKKRVRAAGFDTPLVADIHFTPNAAEIAARLIEKVRINPGNYVDKKKFDIIDYTDAEYHAEIDRIRNRFTPLVKICKEYGTAMRIGTNHGSLSDRIMSRYGDSPIGMVESALEFLRIARDENYHQIILSMKSSNPQVMVQAYRLLVQKMNEEFGMCYPLHLGVTEAGDGEDGRIKSSIGIGTLLEDGIGDTIRVSLTEDPEFEIPVCKDIVAKYNQTQSSISEKLPEIKNTFYSPFSYKKDVTHSIKNIGGSAVPVVIADFSKKESLNITDFESVGYQYNAQDDKWNIGDQAADYIYTGKQIPTFNLPGTLGIIVESQCFTANTPPHIIPLFEIESYKNATQKHTKINFVKISTEEDIDFTNLPSILDNTCVLWLSSKHKFSIHQLRLIISNLKDNKIQNPYIIYTESDGNTPDEHLVQLSTNTGALLLDGFCDGICLSIHSNNTLENIQVTGRTYLPVKDIQQFLNNTSFSILQATRTRISKTEYISCPSCGRTLFDLQETTAKIRAATNHLKGVKIAIMGCIVNGPGEMADADFGYVGSGVGKITLYKNKDVVQKNIPSEVAVDALIQLLKDNGAWIDNTN
jgi:(E)-4-hydroxy-3-methylbut-2-enyl-diphosphate synthase